MKYISTSDLLLFLSFCSVTLFLWFGDGDQFFIPPLNGLPLLGTMLRRSAVVIQMLTPRAAARHQSGSPSTKRPKIAPQTCSSSLESRSFSSCFFAPKFAFTSSRWSCPKSDERGARCNEKFKIYGDWLCSCTSAASLSCLRFREVFCQYHEYKWFHACAAGSQVLFIW